MFVCYFSQCTRMKAYTCWRHATTVRATLCLRTRCYGPAAPGPHRAAFSWHAAAWTCASFLRQSLLWTRIRGSLRAARPRRDWMRWHNCLGTLQPLRWHSLASCVRALSGKFVPRKPSARASSSTRSSGPRTSLSSTWVRLSHLFVPFCSPLGHKKKLKVACQYLTLEAVQHTTINFGVKRWEVFTRRQTMLVGMWQCCLVVNAFTLLLTKSF